MDSRREVARMDHDRGDPLLTAPVKRPAPIAIADNPHRRFQRVRCAYRRTGRPGAKAFEVLDVLMDKLNYRRPVLEAEQDLSEDGSVEIPAHPDVEGRRRPELGDHRIACGDSTKRETVAALFGDDRASMLGPIPPGNVALWVVREPQAG